MVIPIGASPQDAPPPAVVKEPLELQTSLTVVQAHVSCGVCRCVQTRELFFKRLTLLFQKLLQILTNAVFGSVIGSKRNACFAELTGILFASLA